VLNGNPLVVPSDVGRDLVLQLMVVNKIQQVPIVDENRHVVGLHIWDELAAPAERSNCMVIMAGGFGTRLRPHTEQLPKPMLPVSDKPMLQHIIERARSQGFNHFVLAVHYLSHIIEDYFRDGGDFGVQIDYLREETPLGTAGALSLLDPEPELPFVVTNGDVLTDIHYGELLDFHVRQNAAATMAVRAYEWQHPFGVVQTEGVKIVGYEEKPVNRTHINAGVYVLDPGVLRHMEPNSSCDMPALFELLQQKKLHTVAYPMHEPWLDVGRPDDLAAANRGKKQE
jgi:NDP-sugar pyrophosphorylase family protein